MGQTCKAAKKARCYLYIGPSGSGKSSAIVRAVKSFAPSRVYVVNTTPEGFLGDQSLDCEVVQEELQSLPHDERGVSYVIEDVQNISKTDREIVFKLFNVTSRATGSQVHVATHSVKNTGAYSLLPFVNFLFLTSQMINLRTLSTVLKYYFYRDPSAVEASFSRMQPGQYFVLTPPNLGYVVMDKTLSEVGTLDCQDEGSADLEDETPISRETILDYFKHLPNRDEFVPLVDFFLRNFSSGYLRKSDLSVKLITRTGRDPRVSILEYFYVLNSEDSSPTRDIRMFHDFLKSRIVFPSYLIKNHSMR